MQKKNDMKVNIPYCLYFQKFNKSHNNLIQKTNTKIFSRNSFT